ncbi:MAG: hypothetical protein ACRD01_08685 [Terriglobales bacterium]
MTSTLLTPSGLAGLKTGMANACKPLRPDMVMQVWEPCAAYAQGLGE